MRMRGGGGDHEQQEEPATDQAQDPDLGWRVLATRVEETASALSHRRER
jgi:hypothetical protein